MGGQRRSACGTDLAAPRGLGSDGTPGAHQGPDWGEVVRGWNEGFGRRRKRLRTKRGAGGRLEERFARGPAEGRAGGPRVGCRPRGGPLSPPSPPPSPSPPARPARAAAPLPPRGRTAAPRPRAAAAFNGDARLLRPVRPVSRSGPGHGAPVAAAAAAGAGARRRRQVPVPAGPAAQPPPRPAARVSGGSALPAGRGGRKSNRNTRRTFLSLYWCSRLRARGEPGCDQCRPSSSALFLPFSGDFFFLPP